MGMPVTQLASSLAYVDVSITATAPSGYPYNPSADAVHFAFINQVSPRDPVSGDFVPGVWGGPLIGSKINASCLVGPGGAITLAAGTYQIYVKITDNPEVPVLQSDILTII